MTEDEFRVDQFQSGILVRCNLRKGGEQLLGRTVLAGADPAVQLRTCQTQLLFGSIAIRCRQGREVASHDCFHLDLSVPHSAARLTHAQNALDERASLYPIPLSNT